ncbi:acyltransferase [Ornithinimicrobium sp. INDO-MA30-4]|uniref:acyltransferase family protein n=1 Tax=Ornithinimicrobium sp. INDO-MA30-4 TaxID=2908651 RepID=UPI001F2A44B9|nr:acyltransferase [Ornithinimicrobium sp. INDO-MA30-4]UJH70082.1 acyltransferase [Ornithinimicrobium sp. INDO-MA30-4]
MSTETAPPPRRFRRDIEGLRALAVVFVLIHHASASLLPGGFIGVDMFFVVSGFVITTQLVSEVERTGTVNLPGFYARRAKRLLPAAAMVLVFTAIVSWLFASRIQWSLIGTDIAASALYVVNWVFAARSVDYLAEDVEPSPVQHFWSLAVEEQFYVIWPLLIIGLALVSRWLVRRSEAAGEFRLPLRGTLAIGLLALVVVPSLTWGIYYTMASPERAYFVTTTRLWELGIGALVAVLAPTWDRLSQRVGAIVAWLGLLLLFVGLALITLETPWPGAAALAPTLATALIIVGGFKAEEQGPVRVLGLSPWCGLVGCLTRCICGTGRFSPLASGSGAMRACCKASCLLQPPWCRPGLDITWWRSVSGIRRRCLIPLDTHFLSAPTSPCWVLWLV